MAVEIHDLELSGLVLPRDVPGMQRKPVGNRKWHDQAFFDRYDRHTLFYDCFHDARADCVRLIGPPFLNLRSLLEETEFRVDGRLVSIREISDLSRCSVLSLNAAGGRVLGVNHRQFGANLPIGRSYFADLQGLNGIYTISRNNRLDWIRDWLAYYVRAHGLEAVLLCDNGSTDYAPAALRDAIGSVEGLKKAVILRARYPFGPTAQNNTAYSALFLQRSMAELGRVRFFGQARAVLNADIDELFVSKIGQSVFDAAVASELGYVRANAEWVYADPHDRGYPLHRDHRYVSATGKPKANRKWCVVPTGPMRDDQWLTHFIRDRGDPVDPDFRMWHFRQISTNWKYQRSDDDVAYVENPELIEMMGRVFPS